MEPRENLENKSYRDMLVGLTYDVKNIHKEMGDIKEQNGAMSRGLSKLQNWKWFISGGLTLIVVFILPFVFIIAEKLVNQPVLAQTISK